MWRTRHPNSNICHACHWPKRACECGQWGRPGWPGNTRIIPPQPTPEQAKKTEITFDGFDE